MLFKILKNKEYTERGNLDTVNLIYKSLGNVLIAQIGGEC